jgi:hypothetical protein
MSQLGVVMLVSYRLEPDGERTRDYFKHTGIDVPPALGQTGTPGSGDKTARLWETATGKPIGPRIQHRAAVWGVALCADGKTALTASGKSRLLWQRPCCTIQ